jgi:hypothetical protein
MRLPGTDLNIIAGGSAVSIPKLIHFNLSDYLFHFFPDEEMKQRT